MVLIVFINSNIIKQNQRENNWRKYLKTEHYSWWNIWKDQEVSKCSAQSVFKEFQVDQQKLKADLPNSVKTSIVWESLDNIW